MSDRFWFDPDKSFIELPAVRLTLVILSVVCVFLSFLIYTNSGNMVLDLSYEGFAFFLYAYQVPLGVLALSIPILAICAATHRSAQTVEQMALSRGQNNFTNHYHHMDEFDTYIQLLEQASSAIKVKEGHCRHLHARLFPQSRKGIFVYDQSVLAEVKSWTCATKRHIDLASCLNKESFVPYHDRLVQLEDEIVEFLYLNKQSLPRREFELDGRKVELPGDFRNYFTQFQRISSSIVRMLQFERYPDELELVDLFQLSNLDTETHIDVELDPNLTDFPEFDVKWDEVCNPTNTEGSS